MPECSRQMKGWERALERMAASKPGGWYFVNVANRWDLAVDYYAGYATYQERAGERRIPVMVLEPISG